MVSVWTLLRLVHLFALAFGVGGATISMALMMKAGSDKEFAPVFAKVSKIIAKVVFLGLILLTISGIGFFVLGYPEKELLLVKHALVAIIWVAGSLIMFVYSPKLSKLAPKPGNPPTPEFLSVQKTVQTLGIINFICWYATTVLSVLL